MAGLAGQLNITPKQNDLAQVASVLRLDADDAEARRVAAGLELVDAGHPARYVALDADWTSCTSRKGRQRPSRAP